MFFWNRKKKKAQKAAEPVIALAKTQLQMHGKSQKNMPQKAYNDYSLGYLAGMLDAHAMAINIKDVEIKFTALKNAYSEIFGKEKGLEVYHRAETHLKNENSNFYEAMSDGGTEFIKYVNKEIPAPFGWIEYILDSEKI